MKRFIIITIGLLLICGTMFYFISLPHTMSDVTAKGGLLDLTGEDFADTLFTLDGEWEFYYGQLYSPDDFHDSSLTAEDAQMITVPSSWGDAGFPPYGFATYRLTVLTDEPGLMMLVPEILNSAAVWVNGEKVFQVGEVGRTKEETVPYVRNGFVDVRPENGQAEIIIQSSNFEWWTSGLYYRIQIGRTGDLLGDAMMRRVLLGIMIGILLAMCLYHAALFLYQTREKVYLAFALICLFGSVRFFLDTNGLAVLFLPNGIGPGLTIVLELAFLFFTAALLFFAHAVFAIPVRGRIRRGIYAVTFTIAFLVPFLKVSIIISYIFIIPLIWTTVSAMRSGRLRENPYHLLFLFALVVYILWYPFNIFVLGDVLFMPGAVTNLFLMLSQCIMLSVSYAETKHHEEVLTEHNQMLDKLNRSKTEFLQDMSHEMKSPLTVIAAGIDYADRQLGKKDGNFSEAVDALKVIQEETQRLGRMISGMIDLASMNEIGMNRERVDFALLLHQSAEGLRRACEQQGVMLRVEVPPDLPDVFIVRDKLMQVIANLMNNGLDHMADGQMTLSADSDSEYITVRVTDTGRGIEPELLPRIFDRGVSGRDSTGYGLYICKTVVEAHGGRIEVESTVNKGTVVTFTVPVYGGQEAGHGL